MSDPTDPRDPAFLYESVTRDVGLSADELRAFFRDEHPLVEAMAEFRRAYHIYRNTIERYFISQGVTHLQYATLLCLCARDEDTPFSIGELAEHFKLTHSAAVQLINRMEEKELVARVEEGNIARVIVTEAGMALVYGFLMARRPFRPPPLDLRGQLMRAMVHASHMESNFFNARGVAYPRLPFVEQDDAATGPDGWDGADHHENQGNDQDSVTPS